MFPKPDFMKQISESLNTLKLQTLNRFQLFLAVPECSSQHWNNWTKPQNRSNNSLEYEILPLNSEPRSKSEPLFSSPQFRAQGTLPCVATHALSISLHRKAIKSHIKTPKVHNSHEYTSFRFRSLSSLTCFNTPPQIEELMKLLIDYTLHGS